MTDPHPTDPNEPAAPSLPPSNPERPAAAPETGQEAENAVAEPRRRDPLPLIIGLIVVLLIGAVFYVWKHPIGLDRSTQPVQTAATTPSAPAVPAEPAPPEPPTNAPAPSPDHAAKPDEVQAPSTGGAGNSGAEQGNATAPEGQGSGPSGANSSATPPAGPTASPGQPEQGASGAASPGAAPASPGEGGGATAENGPAGKDTAAAPGTGETPSGATASVTGAGQSEPAKPNTAALQQHIEALSQRIDTLEQRKAPEPPDLSPLTQRLDALEKQASSAPGKADLEALSRQLDSLREQQRKAANEAGQTSDDIRASLDSLRKILADVQKRLDTQDERLAKAEKAAGRISILSDQASRTARLQSAASALEAGKPLGTVPDAPPALARFADQPPPSEAALRLSFPDAAQAALAAERPETASQPFWDSVKTRMESLVTIRRGDTVVVGNPAETIIANARQALQAGDLAGAVAAIDRLQGPPAKAFAEWKSRAHALLDARSALAGMTARS